MESAQQILVEALAQHSSYLHRASTATVNQVIALIDESGVAMIREIQDRLDGLTAAELSAFAAGRYTTLRVQALASTIESWASALAEQIDTLFAAEGLSLAGYEAGYMADLLGKATDTAAEATIAGAAALEAAMAQPVLGELVEDMLAGLAERGKQRVYATVRQGIAEGQTNAQIIKALRGTAALQFKDGVLQPLKVSADSVVRTARAHISSVTYDGIYRQLGVKEVMWSAMLELRTCARCAALDRQVFAIDKPHPRNPIHSRCRCQLVPLIDESLMGDRPFVRALRVKGRDGQAEYRSIGRMTAKQRQDAGLQVGQVPAKTSFAQWFDSLPERFQREWLGESRFRLYKEGGYSIDKFTDPLNRAYTLDDLRRLDGETFREVFGD